MNEDDNEFMGVPDKQRKPITKTTQTTTIKVIVKLRPLLTSESSE
jgi:hypothetical protein